MISSLTGSNFGATSFSLLWIAERNAMPFILICISDRFLLTLSPVRLILMTSLFGSTGLLDLSLGLIPWHQRLSGILDVGIFPFQNPVKQLFFRSQGFLTAGAVS